MDLVFVLKWEKAALCHIYKLYLWCQQNKFMQCNLRLSLFR